MRGQRSNPCAPDSLRLLIWQGERVWEDACGVTGRCVRLSAAALRWCSRLQRLFFLNEGQDLSRFLVADLGISRYPSYTVRKPPSGMTLFELKMSSEVYRGLCYLYTEDFVTSNSSKQNLDVGNLDAMDRMNEQKAGLKISVLVLTSVSWEAGAAHKGGVAEPSGFAGL